MNGAVKENMTDASGAGGHNETVSPRFGRVKALVGAITSDSGTSIVQSMLESCGRKDVEMWRDSSGYDVMHYAILSNSQEFVLLMLKKGFFLSPYEPDIVPYLHLACKLGLRTITGFLLDHRPTDNKPAIWQPVEFPIDTSLSCPQSKRTILGEASSYSATACPSLKTPIDIAAEEGHIHCVRFLLDHYVMECSDDHRKARISDLNHLSLAAIVNSPPSLELLLTGGKPSEKAVLEAVEQAVRQARPECLDILLSRGIKTNPLFSGMNLYHVLYQYCSSSLSSALSHYGVYPQLTAILIKYGYDVNAKSPQRTYPLYSLLGSDHFMLASLENGYLKECLRLLLEAGADPNFDEAGCDDENKSRAFGRKAYPSAIFCLFGCAVNLVHAYPEHQAKINLILVDSLEQLLCHGADARKEAAIFSPMDDGGGSYRSVLEEYVYCCPLLGVDRRILALLLGKGADAMARSDDGQNLIMTYSLVQFAISQSREDAARGNKTTLDQLHRKSIFHAERLMYLCDYMSLEFVKTCSEELAKKFEWDSDSFVFSDILGELAKYQRNVRSLKRESSLIIWRRCSYSEKKVQSLPLPTSLKHFIIPK